MRVIPLFGQPRWGEPFLVTFRMRGDAVMTYTLVVEKEQWRCHLEIEDCVMPRDWTVTVNGAPYRPYDAMEILWRITISEVPLY